MAGLHAPSPSGKETCASRRDTPAKVLRRVGSPGDVNGKIWSRPTQDADNCNPEDEDEGGMESHNDLHEQPMRMPTTFSSGWVRGPAAT